MIVTPLLMWVQVPSAVPPPLPQITADCVHTVYASDKLVCADPALRVLDRELANLVERARSSDGSSAAEADTVEAQTAWFVRSRRCAFSTLQRACLIAAYHERLNILRVTPLTAKPAGTCESGADLFLTEWGGVIQRDAKPVIGVLRTSSWKAFVSFERSGRNVRFVGLDGGVIARCKITGRVR